jgi:hypothetical protein
VKALPGCSGDCTAQLQLGTVSTRDDRLPLMKATWVYSIHAPLSTERHILRPHAIILCKIFREPDAGTRKFTETKRSQSRPMV